MGTLKSMFCNCVIDDFCVIEYKLCLELKLVYDQVNNDYLDIGMTESSMEYLPKVSTYIYFF